MEFVYILFSVFAIVSVLYVVQRIRQILQERRFNSAYPVRSVPATVVCKSHTSPVGGYQALPCYIVFELSGGERITLRVNSIYWVLAEGDQGILTYQGRRYYHFQR